MNSIGKSAKGAIILLLALVVGTWVISRTTSSPLSAEGGSGDSPEVTTTVASSTTTTSALPARDRKTVTVLMVNGTKTDGIAKRARSCVVSAFDALPPTNSATKPAQTALYAQPGFEAEAREVASALSIQVEPLPFPAVPPSVKAMPNPLPNVLLIIGDDIASGIRNLPCAVSVVPG